MTTAKPWTGPVAHLSKSVHGGGAPACGNRNAHLSLDKAGFNSEPVNNRCELCQRINLSRGGKQRVTAA